jgi:hypothetical protein
MAASQSPKSRSAHAIGSEIRTDSRNSGTHERIFSQISSASSSPLLSETRNQQKSQNADPSDGKHEADHHESLPEPVIVTIAKPQKRDAN